MANRHFPTGASYYPPHHDAEDWARDVAAMAAAGMTCIRSAELLASWDYIEKVRGQPDWGWLDALFAAAERHGIGILLGTGSPCPPIWLLDLYPDVRILDRDDRPFPTGTVWGWACRNHPGYRAEVERFLRLLLARYHDHPALWAWQIDNEPGYPFVARRGETTPRIHDYNAHTAGAFRAWLQAKYETLDALNVAWRWDCTHHQYTEWRQVQPPRSMPQEWGIVTAWLDWRTFLNENMAAFIRWQHEIIRSKDTRHPTMTNIFALSGREVEMALDPWLMAAQADAIGYDMYPGIGQRLHRDPAYISMLLDFGRSSAIHAGTEFWLPELESGPISGWALGPDYTTMPADITRYNLEALAHGAKAILYQGYREWPCIPIHWGALADFEGRPTPRYAAAQAINKMVGKHAALFRDAQPARAEVAIYLDTRNITLLHGMGALDLHDRCLRGAYTALWQAGYPLEFVDSAALCGKRRPTTDDRRTTDDGQPTTDNRRRTTDDGLLTTDRYKVILLPCAMMIDQATALALRQFVEAGGTLIGFAKCAWVDRRGWSWARQPGAGLEGLFGVTAGEVERVESVELSVENSTELTPSSVNIPGYWHRQPLIPLAGAEVLAQFADGSAALVRNKVGQGTALYVGTHLDAAALESPAATQLLCSLVAQAGVETFRVETESAVIDAHLLTSDSQRLVVLTNNGAQVATVRVDGATTNAQELLGDQHLHADANGSVSVQIEAWGGAVVAFDKR